ncbi:MAG: hypothetical protein ABIG20_01140 [archaeon]
MILNRKGHHNPLLVVVCNGLIVILALTLLKGPEFGVEIAAFSSLALIVILVLALVGMLPW